MKALYKPIGLLFSVLGGIVAGALFKQLWRAVAGEDDSPDAKDRERGWGEIVSAAAVQGAVFGTVKALVDRAGAKGFERATGVWPGNTEPPDKAQ
jgi:predicted metal-dependent enzyme (double-stranded beta helix superfamily)